MSSRAPRSRPSGRSTPTTSPSTTAPTGWRTSPCPPARSSTCAARAPYWNGHGKGVITEHGAALGLAATVATYASGVFTSGIPAGYLKSNQPNMTADQAQTLKSTWLAQHGGTKRSIAVLNATTEFHPISISPVDAQLASTREWSLRDVALAFGVPAYMLGVPGDSSTYANVESRMIELRTFTLLPWQRRIESTLDAQLPKGTSLKVRSDGLLRADTSTRYNAYTTALDRRVADRRRGPRARGPPTTAERRGVVMTDQLAMEIRSVDDAERRIVGVVAPYDETTYLVPDPGGERIMRGALQGSIDHDRGAEKSSRCTTTTSTHYAHG